MLERDLWRKVVEAIENAQPSYDRVNNIISFGRADEARLRAIRSLDLRDHIQILDSGIGPGNATKILLSEIKPRMIVGLDESVKQLKHTKETMKDGALDFVRGVFEWLPFKEGAFDAIVTCYALRDSLDQAKSVGEYARVCSRQGALAVVDIGKSEIRFKRIVSLLYLRFVMPVLAKITAGRKIKGNPWRMIIPTYMALPTNQELLKLMKSQFSRVELREFLMGGLIVVIARKT